MERWERIERVVLLAACLCLVSVSVWLFFAESGVRLMIALVPLPFAFWALWQALYEDKLASPEPPTVGERIAYLSWLAARRVVLGFIAVAMGCAAFALASRADSVGQFVGAGVVALLTLLAGWVALFGGGIDRSMSDDLSVYNRRRKRHNARPNSEA